MPCCVWWRPGVSAKDQAALELGRSLKAWLDLQAAVNGLIDSTTAPDKSIMVRRVRRVK